MFYILDHSRIVGKVSIQIREQIERIFPKLQADKLLFRKKNQGKEYKISHKNYYFYYNGTFHFYDENELEKVKKSEIETKLIEEMKTYLKNNNINLTKINDIVLY